MFTDEQINESCSLQALLWNNFLPLDLSVFPKQRKPKLTAATVSMVWSVTVSLGSFARKQPVCTALLLPAYEGSSCSWVASAPPRGREPGHAPAAPEDSGWIHAYKGSTVWAHALFLGPGCLRICSFLGSWKLKESGKKRPKEKLEINNI